MAAKKATITLEDLDAAAEALELSYLILADLAAQMRAAELHSISLAWTDADWDAIDRVSKLAAGVGAKGISKVVEGARATRSEKKSPKRSG